MAAAGTDRDGATVGMGVATGAATGTDMASVRAGVGILTPAAGYGPAIKSSDSQSMKKKSPRVIPARGARFQNRLNLISHFSNDPRSP